MYSLRKVHTLISMIRSLEARISPSALYLGLEDEYYRTGDN